MCYHKSSLSSKLEMLAGVALATTLASCSERDNFIPVFLFVGCVEDDDGTFLTTLSEKFFLDKNFLCDSAFILVGNFFL